jgi:hypothetical protein
MVAGIPSGRHGNIKFLRAQVSHQLAHFRPWPMPKLIFSVECCPRCFERIDRNVWPEIRTNLYGYALGKEADLVPSAGGNKKGGCQSQIAQVPLFEDEKLHLTW